MELNNLQLSRSWRTAQISGAPSGFRAVHLRTAMVLVAALVGLMLLTVGCHEHPARTEVPMPSDPLQHIDESLLTGTWLLDGDYVQIARAQSGFELRRKERGDPSKEKSMPFHLARLGDALFFEFEEAATEAHPTLYWPCRIDVVDKALQLYCFYLDDVAEKRPDIQLRMKEFEDSEEIVDLDSDEIRDLYTRVAFDPNVFSLDMILKRPQPEIVARMLRRAAAGSADAQEQLARFYIDADYVARDGQEAEKWLRRAADQGHAKAQYELGELLLESGPPDQRDNEEILFWFRRSSEKGYAPAFGAAGKMYQYGGGIPADAAHAIQWYQAGAEHSDDVSHYELGLMQLAGEWVQRDERQALLHFLAAVAINPNDEDYWEEIAALRLRATDHSLHDIALALDAAQRAVAIEKTSRNMELLAEAQFQNGQYLAAVKTYREVLKAGNVPDTEEANRRLEQYESAVALGLGGAL